MTAVLVVERLFLVCALIMGVSICVGEELTNTSTTNQLLACAAQNKTADGLDPLSTDTAAAFTPIFEMHEEPTLKNFFNSEGGAVVRTGAVSDFIWRSSSLRKGFGCSENLGLPKFTETEDPLNLCLILVLITLTIITCNNYLERVKELVHPLVMKNEKVDTFDTSLFNSKCIHLVFSLATINLKKLHINFSILKIFSFASCRHILCSRRNIEKRHKTLPFLRGPILVAVIFAIQSGFVSSEVIKGKSTPSYVESITLHNDTQISQLLLKVKSRAAKNDNELVNDVHLNRYNVSLDKTAEMGEERGIEQSYELRNKIENVEEAIRQFIINLNNSYIIERVKWDTATTNSEGAANGVSSFTRPNTTNKLTRLENEMRKLKEDIEWLKKSSTVSSEDSIRLTSVETTLETLKKLLDEQNRETLKKTENLERLVESLIGIINGFRKELDDIKSKAETRERVEQQRRLPDECIEAIKSHNFKMAETKLEEINDNSKINLIIKEVYNHQIGSFDLVRSFGDSLGNVERRFSVYKALGYEMQSNGHKDPFKLIQLIESLKSNISNQPSTTGKLAEEVSSLIKTLETIIGNVLKEKLKAGMVNNNYIHNTDIQELSNKIQLYKGGIFDVAIKETISDVYGDVGIENILKFVRSHYYIEQFISAYVGVLDQIKSRGVLYTDAAALLGTYVKEIMDMNVYNNVNFAFRMELERVKSELPESVRLMIFSSSVCIKNNYYKEYLYAANNEHAYDDDRRRVLTWIPGSPVFQGSWKFTYDNGSFFIYNLYQKEYLYSASDPFNYDEERRQVFTWIKKNALGNQFRWKVEFDQENVRFKNVEYSEYLFADFDRKYDSDRRHVFTLIPGFKPFDGVWSLQACA